MPQRPSAAGSVPKGDVVRHPVEEDHPRLQVALTDWWGGLGGETGAMQRRLLVPRLFLQHFRDTSFVVESDDGALRAFLVGFLSQSEPETAYIHFVGVCPQRRRTGLGSRLYRDFFELARGRGRSRVRCSPIAFGMGGTPTARSTSTPSRTTRGWASAWSRATVRAAAAGAARWAGTSPARRTTTVRALTACVSYGS
ncbi:MAG TPA: GNAT family N-acetyltransferase [Streptomyces sp.]|nr:GNAT family N-acetyltransferase [Streptomyces sp.]